MTMPNCSPGMRRRLSLVLSAILIAVCALTACGQVTPNQTETTSPKLTWRVTYPDHSIFSYIGGATVPGMVGATYHVTLFADDPGGVRQITFDRGEAFTCTDGSVSSGAGPSNDPVQTVNSQLTNGKALSELWMSGDALLTYNCPNGMYLSGGYVSFDGTATNYANHKAMGTLELHI
jgi:hypothetical protein